MAFAWFVVGEAWVKSDSIIPMWAVAAGTVLVAATLSVWRPRRFLGLSAGLIVSAGFTAGLFTLISASPALD